MLKFINAPLNRKNRKLFPFFLCFCLIVACFTSKPFNELSPIAKIEGQTIYHADGTKGKLPMNKKQNPTVIYLVRHAEKAAEGGKDPLLTEEGAARANRLNSILRKAGIDKIYSTDYQRTQLTAKPTADALEKNILSYNPRDLKNFAKDLKMNHQGQGILVVGHSNTTPTLVNELLGTEQFSMIDESEYGHLFVVTISEKGTVGVMDLRY